MTRSPVLCALLVLLLLLPSLVVSQTTHNETVIWNFVNGVKSRGVFLEPGGGGGDGGMSGGPATAADQLFVSTGPGMAHWLTLPSCALSYDATTHLFGCAPAGPGTSIGSDGVLQSADGAGGFGAYTGSGPCGPGLFMTELLPTGLAVCGTPVAPSSTAHLLTDRAEALIPNAVNLATRGTGVLQSTVSGGIATIATLPVPAGGLAGLSGPQTLLNTFVPLRPQPPFPANVTPLVFDLNYDLAVANELLQNTLFGNPSGSSANAQIVWMSLHSTVPRLLTWGATWTADNGVPLPTSTTGGSVYDLLVFIYNPSTGKLALAYSSQLLRGDTVTGVVAGDYTCPATLSVDMHGRITALTSGTCGGGGGGATPAGIAGDVQLSGGGVLAADTGTFTHDQASHITYSQQIQAGAGSGYLKFTSARGVESWLFPSELTGERAYKLPDASGTLALLSDISAGGGSVTTSGSPTSGQAAEFTGAAVVTGVAVTGTGSYVKATSPVLVTPNLGTPSAAILSNATGLPLTTGVTGNLPVGNLNGGASASSSTYWRGDGTWNTPAGGGNVSNSGTPTSGQLATWTSATVLQGITALPAANFPALTGDVTTSAGSLTTTLANVPTGTPHAGSVLSTNIAAPGNPASGKVSLFSDATDLRFHDRNAAGVTGTTVVADAGASNNFLTAISVAGAISKAQPNFTNLSGSVAASQMPALTGDCTTSAGAVATTCTKVNGVAYSATPATDTIPVVTASNTTTYKTIPDCDDTGGNHLNYDTTAHAWSCGTSGGAASISGATANGAVYATAAGAATSTAALTNGQVLIGSTGVPPVAAALTGTANQVAVTNGAGTITLSIPSSPTLPGTTTGTFSGPLTGNVTGTVSGNAGTATALAANGGNCAAGLLAAGVDASGVAEGCITLGAVNAQTTTYQVLAGDFQAYKTITVASGTFTITLVASGAQPASGQYIRVINYGSGVVTIARSGQNLNGGTSSLTLAPGSATAPTAASIVSDGTNYFASAGWQNPMTAAGDMIYGGTSGTPTRLPAGTGFVYQNGASAPTAAKLARAISLTVGSTTGTALTTAESDLVTIPFACTISAYTLLLDAADTTVRVKLMRVADGGTAIPTIGSNSINTSGWGVSTGTRLHSTTLSDLTSTAIAKDDTVGLAVSVANTAKMANLTLQCDQ